MAAIKINTAARNAMATALAALVDGGSGPGVLRIYSGAQPASPATSPSGTLLAEVTLNDPAFGSPATGVITLSVSPALSDASANNSGTAGYARICDSTEAAGTGLGVVDGAVTATGGGGFVELSSTSVTSGNPVNITSGTITVPAT
jgi:hypothetical protein